MCPLCKTKHYAREPHVFDDGKEAKGVRKTDAGIRDRPVPQGIFRVDRASERAKTETSKKVEKVKRNPGDRLENRVSREYHNAYQKDYMKVWRAVKSGRACSWPK